MALCIEPTLQHRDLGATLVASIPVYSLTPDIEPGPQPQPSLKATLTAGAIVRGDMKGSVVSGRVSGRVVAGSLGHTSLTGSLTKPSFVVTLSSQQHPQAALTANAPVNATLSLGQMAEATLTGNTMDAYMAVSCPIEYVTSCFSLGGWDDDLGWDDNKGWKN